MQEVPEERGTISGRRYRQCEAGKETKSQGGSYRAILSAGELRQGKTETRMEYEGKTKKEGLGLRPSPWETREEPAFRTVAGSTVAPSPRAHFFAGGGDCAVCRSVKAK